MKQNEEENDEKKKRCRLLLGYCPFSACTGSRYSNLYHDTEAGKAGLGAARGPRHGQDSTTTWSSLHHDTADPRVRQAARARARQAARARARAWPLGAGSRYKIVSWLRGGDHVSRYRAARGCDTTTVHHDTTLGAADEYTIEQ